MEKRPATQQLLASIDRYVKSDRFNPQVDVEASFIESFLRKQGKNEKFQFYSKSFVSDICIGTGNTDVGDGFFGANLRRSAGGRGIAADE